MTILDLIASFAARTPTLTRGALWCATRLAMGTGRKLHWRAVQAAARVDYRAPVIAKLGNGMKCQVPWIDHAGRAIYETGWYEPDTVFAFQAILKSGDTFLDIGASFGQYTLLASKIIGDAGRVFAFEPDPVSFSWLAGNVRRNHLKNATLESIALGEQNDTLDLYVVGPAKFTRAPRRRPTRADTAVTDTVDLVAQRHAEQFAARWRCMPRTTPPARRAKEGPPAPWRRSPAAASGC